MRLDDGRVTFVLPHLGRHLDTLTPLLLSGPTPEESATGDLVLHATSPWAALHAYVYHVLPRLPPQERHAMSARLSRVLATVAHHVTAHALHSGQPAQPAMSERHGYSAAGAAAAAGKSFAESAAEKLGCMAQLTQRLDALVAGDLYNEQVVSRVKNVLRRQAALLCQAHFILQKWHVSDESGLMRKLAQCLRRESDADKVDGSCFARLAMASAPPPRQDEGQPPVVRPSPMELCGHPASAAHVVAGSWAALRACVEADAEQCLGNAASPRLDASRPERIFAGASAALLSTIPFTSAEVGSIDEYASSHTTEPQTSPARMTDFSTLSHTKSQLVPLGDNAGHDGAARTALLDLARIAGKSREGTRKGLVEEEQLLHPPNPRLHPRQRLLRHARFGRLVVLLPPPEAARGGEPHHATIFVKAT